jgi:antirestriction protein ArdC
LTCETDAASWYATALHEGTRASGARHRLNREFGKRFGDQQYVAEELVAEIAPAILCAELSITQDTRPDHAQYLAHWLKLWRAAHKRSNREVSVM